MATRLTQASVNRAMEEHQPGVQLYDSEVSGLRVVVGKRGCSYKFVGRINDGTDRYISVVLGRTGDVALKSARDRSTELKLALRRGEDPRTPKATVPRLTEAFDRYLESRPDLSPRTVTWYRQKIEGPLRPLAKLPVDKVDRETVRALGPRQDSNWSWRKAAIASVPSRFVSSPSPARAKAVLASSKPLNSFAPSWSKKLLTDIRPPPRQQPIRSPPYRSAGTRFRTTSTPAPQHPPL